MAKYEITRKIGTGAFGNVYLLQTGRGNSRKFALKVVNTLRLKSNKGDEGTLMLKLCHDHLVHCYDAFICSPHLYLILGLCRHGSLEQYLCERRSLVPERQILSWLAQLADVLRYMHALKVIHRDLKPANIFLDENQSVKLGDLGVASELDHTEQERQTAAGTLPYMSPEAFSGLPYNYKTDVWSLGCCIHEAMTLNKTFQGQSWAALYHMITNGQVPEMPSLYQRKLRKLVLSLLDADSNRRPDALEILLVLFQIQGKQFSSEPSQPVNAAPFDHKQICDVLKMYEISSGSDTIWPLRADDSVDDYRNTQNTIQGSRLSNENFSNNDSDTEGYNSDKAAKDGRPGDEQNWDTFQHKESASPARPLPVPRKARKKKRILKTLKTQTKTDEVESSDIDSTVLDTTNDSNNDNNPRLSPPPASNPSLKSSSHSSNLSENDHRNVDSPHSQTNSFTDDYMEALTRDSIQWLRDRFKPNSSDSQLSTSTEDDDDDDDEVTSGLVTLFTQSQTAVYINNKTKPPSASESGNRNTQEEEGMGLDLSESAVQAAKNTVEVFRGEDPHILKLMLIKILGLRGFTLYGQQLLQ